MLNNILGFISILLMIYLFYLIGGYAVLLIGFCMIGGIITGKTADYLKNRKNKRKEK